MSKIKTNNLVTQIVKKLRKNTPNVLITVGVFFMVISATHWILRSRSLRMNAAVIAEYTQVQEMRPIVPTHIYIKWFIDTDIEPQVYEQGEWTVSENAASYLMQSAPIGTNGNSIIYGHNKNHLFGPIRWLIKDDQIRIVNKKGQDFAYQVIETKTVTPENVEILSPSKDSTLTLYTCTGFLDKQRFVVIAKLQPE